MINFTHILLKQLKTHYPNTSPVFSTASYTQLLSMVFEFNGFTAQIFYDVFGVMGCFEWGIQGVLGTT